MVRRRSVALRLSDIVEAADRVRDVLSDLSIDDFEADWQRVWLVQRGVEIISEASRHLTDDIKARHPEIPWRNVAGIGNVLRHGYETVAAAVLWRLVRNDLPILAAICQAELAQEGDN
jgi:uncharacterized protein with HEPN domain